MRCVDSSLFVTLIIGLITCTGCNTDDQCHTPDHKLSYDCAVEKAKDYLLETEFYSKREDAKFIYESDSVFWTMYSSRNPQMLEEYGLAQRDYHAILFLTAIGTRDGGATVFVDKDEKRVVGVLYGNDFVKASESQ